MSDKPFCPIIKDLCREDCRAMDNKGCMIFDLAGFMLDDYIKDDYDGNDPADILYLDELDSEQLIDELYEEIRKGELDEAETINRFFLQYGFPEKINNTNIFLKKNNIAFNALQRIREMEEQENEEKLELHKGLVMEKFPEFIQWLKGRKVSKVTKQEIQYYYSNLGIDILADQKNSIYILANDYLKREKEKTS